MLARRKIQEGVGREIEVVEIINVVVGFMVGSLGLVLVLSMTTILIDILTGYPMIAITVPDNIYHNYLIAFLNVSAGDYFLGN